MYKEPKEDSNTLSQTSAIVGIGEISLVSLELASNHEQESERVVLSEFQVASLIFDGLTGGIQDKIRDKHQAQAYHMMYSMNLWSCLWTALAILFSNEVTDLLVFLENNPSVLPRIFLLGLTGAIGQVNIDSDLCTLFFSPLHRFVHVEFHLLNSRMVRSFDMCNLYNDQEVLYHPLFCSYLWQSHHIPTDLWDMLCFSRSISRSTPWEEKALNFAFILFDWTNRFRSRNKLSADAQKVERAKIYHVSILFCSLDEQTSATIFFSFVRENAKTIRTYKKTANDLSSCRQNVLCY